MLSNPVSFHQSSHAYSATEYLEQLFEFAIREQISDIHLEPSENGLQIRLRQDGLLYPYPSPASSLDNAIIARLKVLATLDIGEKRLPQEGEFTYPISNILSMHMRISTCPTFYGEKIVLRLFNINNDKISLSSLGLSENQLTLLTNALAQPQGLILVTGPTGSGKSTTLYSALQHLNDGSLNIMTAEDPIEIKLPGIQQVAIKPQLGFGFEAALRTFLRQDPDIIMIGEIRDRETASIALQAAQTGHLVLATLHTSDCLHTISRLLLLGIDINLLADSLLLVMTQRLLRHRTHKGRFGIFEILPVSATLQELIRQKAALPELEKQVLLEGFINLKQEARSKIEQGFTSLDEVHRVVGL